MHSHRQKSISFGQIVAYGPAHFGFVELHDQVLLILLIVGLLYIVQVSLRGRALAAEPFLMVGLISAIRRVLQCPLCNRLHLLAIRNQDILIK
jgi:hypothetical protein